MKRLVAALTALSLPLSAFPAAAATRTVALPERPASAGPRASAAAVPVLPGASMRAGARPDAVERGGPAVQVLAAAPGASGPSLAVELGGSVRTVDARVPWEAAAAFASAFNPRFDRPADARLDKVEVDDKYSDDMGVAWGDKGEGQLEALRAALVRHDLKPRLPGGGVVYYIDLKGKTEADLLRLSSEKIVTRLTFNSRVARRLEGAARLEARAQEERRAAPASRGSDLPVDDDFAALAKTWLRGAAAYAAWDADGLGTPFGDAVVGAESIPAALLRRALGLRPAFAPRAQERTAPAGVRSSDLPVEDDFMSLAKRSAPGAAAPAAAFDPHRKELAAATLVPGPVLVQPNHVMVVGAFSIGRKDFVVTDDRTTREVKVLRANPDGSLDPNPVSTLVPPQQSEEWSRGHSVRAGWDPKLRLLFLGGEKGWLGVYGVSQEGVVEPKPRQTLRVNFGRYGHDTVSAVAVDARRGIVYTASQGFLEARAIGDDGRVEDRYLSRVVLGEGDKAGYQGNSALYLDTAARQLIIVGGIPDAHFGQEYILETRKLDREGRIAQKPSQRFTMDESWMLSSAWDQRARLLYVTTVQGALSVRRLGRNGWLPKRPTATATLPGGVERLFGAALLPSARTIAMAGPYPHPRKDAELRLWTPLSVGDEESRESPAAAPSQPRAGDLPVDDDLMAVARRAAAPASAPARVFDPSRVPPELAKLTTADHAEGTTLPLVLEPEAVEVRGALGTFSQLRDLLERHGVKKSRGANFANFAGRNYSMRGFKATEQDDAIAKIVALLREPLVSEVAVSRVVAALIKRRFAREAEKASSPGPASASDLPVDDDFHALARKLASDAKAPTAAFAPHREAPLPVEKLSYGKPGEPWFDDVVVGADFEHKDELFAAMARLGFQHPEQAGDARRRMSTIYSPTGVYAHAVFKVRQEDPRNADWDAREKIAALARLPFVKGIYLNERLGRAVERRARADAAREGSSVPGASDLPVDDDFAALARRTR